ncbi:MAG: thioredoxin family protein [Chloroflexota bacterium]|nr:MAG: thioredoxin family protein [Chloroflexota bacterium]
MMIAIKILGNKPHLRYSVRRVVTAACKKLCEEYPGLEFSITEVKESRQIFAYTPVLVSPALVINEKLVYDQWIPTYAQVMGWLRAAVEDQIQPGSPDSQANP